MKISLCGPVMNRKHYLQKTLPNVLKLDGSLEVIIYDISSSDGLYHWLEEVGALDRVSYYRLDGNRIWHHPWCFNLAMKKGTGDLLIRWSVDNFISGEYLDYVIATHTGSGKVCTRGWLGSHGRIGISRETFYELGGFDEEMIGWGYDDIDFIERAKLLGGREIVFPDKFNSYIRHPRTDSGLYQDETCAQNRRLSQEKRKNHCPPQDRWGEEIDWLVPDEYFGTTTEIDGRKLEFGRDGIVTEVNTGRKGIFHYNKKLIIRWPK